jgi:hypothetical protein
MQEGVAPIYLCVPETTIQPLSRMLNHDNSVALTNHALVWSDGPGSTLRLVTMEEAPPPRILSRGIPHPDDRLGFMLSVVEGTPGYVPPPENLQQTDENKVVDLPGDEFDLYRETSTGDASEVLRPTAGTWRGRRLSMLCHIDPRLLEYFDGASYCVLNSESGDLSYSISLGRTWLQYWPDVVVAVEETVGRYRERCT